MVFKIPNVRILNGSANNLINGTIVQFTKVKNTTNTIAGTTETEKSPRT